jgi:hypothetical protein
MKNMYEVFDEFELATNRKGKMDVIGKNLSKTLIQVLELAFHPKYEWLQHEVPSGYQIKTTPPGMGYAQLSVEIRKMYMFRKGDPTAEKLTPHKRSQLLVEFLQNLEPREAEVVIGIFNKDLGVPGLDYRFVKEAFPHLLP